MTEPYYHFAISYDKELAQMQVDAILHDVFQGQKENLRHHLMHVMAKAERAYVEREKIRPGGRYRRDNDPVAIETESGAFFNPPSRVWEREGSDLMRTYISVKGKPTMAELLAFARSLKPDIQPDDIRVNFATVEWTDEATEEELEQRRQWEKAHEERNEKWQRDQYEKLKAKFESLPRVEAECPKCLSEQSHEDLGCHHLRCADCTETFERPS